MDFPWLHSCLCLGTAGDSPHVFLQVDAKGSIKELFPTGKQLEPLVAPLADGKVAVGQDDLTVVLNEEGICTQKCALNWTDIPVAMGKASSSCCSVVWVEYMSSLQNRFYHGSGRLPTFLYSHPTLLHPPATPLPTPSPTFFVSLCSPGCFRTP